MQGTQCHQTVFIATVCLERKKDISFKLSVPRILKKYFVMLKKYLSVLKYWEYLGHLKIINFPFVPNGTLNYFLGVPKFGHITA